MIVAGGFREEGDGALEAGEGWEGSVVSGWVGFEGGHDRSGQVFGEKAGT